MLSAISALGGATYKWEDSGRRLVVTGKIQSITEEIIPFERLPEGVDRLLHSKVAGRIVVDFNA